MKEETAPDAALAIGCHRMVADSGAGRSTGRDSSATGMIGESVAPGVRKRATRPRTPSITRFHIRLPGRPSEPALKYPPPGGASTAREGPHHPIPKLQRVVKALHPDPLVPAVGADVVLLLEDRGHAVGGDAGIAQKEAVRGPGFHDGRSEERRVGKECRA